MAVLVVFESMFASTQAVAEAIGAGLASAGHLVTVAEVGLAGEPRMRHRAELLVVGAPTHNRGLPSPTTRERAREGDVATVSPGDGVREWLETLGATVRGVPAATFDTVVASRVAGSAAARIAHGLRRSGAHLVAPPESFVVRSRTGGLVDGELDRAWTWGRQIGEVPARAASAR
jgi:hypothetical protein